VGIAVVSKGSGDWVTSLGRSMVAISPLCEMCAKEWHSPPRQGRWEFGRESDGLAPETDLTAGGKMKITPVTCLGDCRCLQPMIWIGLD